MNDDAYSDPLKERDPVSIMLKLLAVMVLAGGLTAVGYMMNDDNVIAYLRAITTG